LDIVVKELNTTRSAFTREALREAVKRYNIRRMEEKHRRGYAMYPVKKGEFDLR
jgi:metal-responsive CopG/Arc/MetJ family transcriptional regulator